MCRELATASEPRERSGDRGAPRASVEGGPAGRSPPVKKVPRRVAVERNLAIVRRAAYDTTDLADGDQIGIVNFVGGG